MPRYRAIFTEPPIQFNRQDFSHNVLFAMPNRIYKVQLLALEVQTYTIEILTLRELVRGRMQKPRAAITPIWTLQEIVKPLNSTRNLMRQNPTAYLVALIQTSRSLWELYASYARINDSPYKALTRTSLTFDWYSDELLDKSKLTTPKDAFVVVVLGSNVV